VAATGAKGEAGKAVAAFLRSSCPPSLIDDLRLVKDGCRAGAHA
jgi:hypothetical protein